MVNQLVFSIDLDGLSPGLSVGFQIDLDSDSDMVSYLDENFLHIDIWDGDSLLYLGSSELQLRPLLRQGKPGVAFEDDLDICVEEITGEHRDGVSSSNSHSSGLNQLANTSVYPSPPVIGGKLHVRISNIGAEARNSENRVVKKTPDILIYDYHHFINTRPPLISYPKRMPDIDSELYEMLSHNYRERMKERKLEQFDADKSSDEKKRKLDQIKRLKENKNIAKVMGHNEKNPGHLYQMTRQERQRDLQTMDLFRERRKITTIQGALKDQITSKHVLNVTFGTAYFFEFFFNNPYSHEQNFEIVWDDQELRYLLLI